MAIIQYFVPGEVWYTSTLQHSSTQQRQAGYHK